MPQEVNIILSPEESSDKNVHLRVVSNKLGVSPDRIAMMRIVRRSIDARGHNIKINLGFQVFIDDQRPADDIHFEWNDVSTKSPVIVIGSGPAGLFAALRLIENGFKPIILERGKDVSLRKRDIASINRNEPINPDSNYCFGEGGAGTYSDGKLYTRSKKRGNHKKALDILHYHGADESILYDAHPHIGTEKLPEVIKSIRQTILSFGGEVVFNFRVTDLIIKENKILGVINDSGDRVEGIATILATGHSARDIYELLDRKGIKIEAKSFAMGVRVEHPQELIDSIQYHTPHRGDYLPAASYSLVSQVGGRGVYSFCMCPGGFIVPASTDQNQSVVNGMSPSGRNSVFANSGIVTEIRTEDFQYLRAKHGELAGLKYQQMYEMLAHENGGGSQIAPAQRLTDFVSGKISTSLPKTSYHPGTVSSDMNLWMPELISSHLKEGFKSFGDKMRGFLTSESMILGVESRTSSPVRVPRDPDTLEHPQISGLYPCGEGAGYAGGIISAGIDGERVADAICSIYQGVISV